MATLIGAVTHFAPDTLHYRLDDGRHVLIIVPAIDQPLPPGAARDAVLGIAGAVTTTVAPTEVLLCDENAVPIDADGDPCNGLTALAEYETGTTHLEALDRLET